MTREGEKLKLAKLSKARLKQLPQQDDTWGADFRALPKPMGQSLTHYRGMVVVKKGGSPLAESHAEGRPSVNDLAALLAHAMRRPLNGDAHSPRRIHVRGRPQWRELFPHLEELGIQVSVHRELPKIDAAYREHLRQKRDAHRVGMVKPTPDQASIEKLFPTVARYVQGYGYIEIGEQESFGFVARAIGYGNIDFEDDRPNTLAEALAALEMGLSEKLKEEGIDLE